MRRLLWGKGVLEKGFDCRLQSVDVKYTAFDRDGSPLHAELSAVFTVYSPYAFSETERLLIQYIADELAGAVENREPPVPMYNLMGAAIH